MKHSELVQVSPATWRSAAG